MNLKVYYAFGISVFLRDRFQILKLKRNTIKNNNPAEIINADDEFKEKIIKVNNIATKISPTCQRKQTNRSIGQLRRILPQNYFLFYT